MVELNGELLSGLSDEVLQEIVRDGEQQGSSDTVSGCHQCSRLFLL